MIRRIHSLLSILVVAASAATLGGCAVETAPDSESAGSAVDALIDRDDDGTPDAVEEDAEEPATPTHIAPRLDAARGLPAHAQDWATTEPQPVPWHEKKTSATGSDDDDDTNPSWAYLDGRGDDR